ncbi:MAG: prenyltransferase, partial [Dehalococcoidia bacterium]|nr:prenyltransferase [Dehalococcoidia bacterium]
RDPMGGFKTGIKLPEELIWPEEKNTWTSAGVIIAASAQARVDGEDVG